MQLRREVTEVTEVTEDTSRQALTMVSLTLIRTKQTNENKTRGGTCVQEMINDDKVQFQDDRREGLLRSV